MTDFDGCIPYHLQQKNIRHGSAVRFYASFRFPLEEFPLDREKQLTILALPAQHWANRWPWDRNCSLWCGALEVTHKFWEVGARYRYLDPTGP